MFNYSVAQCCSASWFYFIYQTRPSTSVSLDPITCLVTCTSSQGKSITDTGLTQTQTYSDTLGGMIGVTWSCSHILCKIQNMRKIGRGDNGENIPQVWASLRVCLYSPVLYIRIKLLDDMYRSVNINMNFGLSGEGLISHNWRNQSVVLSQKRPLCSDPIMSIKRNIKVLYMYF